MQSQQYILYVQLASKQEDNSTTEHDTDSTHSVYTIFLIHLI